MKAQITVSLAEAQRLAAAELSREFQGRFANGEVEVKIEVDHGYYNKVRAITVFRDNLAALGQPKMSLINMKNVVEAVIAASRT